MKEAPPQLNWLVDSHGTCSKGKKGCHLLPLGTWKVAAPKLMSSDPAGGGASGGAHRPRRVAAGGGGGERPLGEGTAAFARGGFGIHGFGGFLAVFGFCRCLAGFVGSFLVGNPQKGTRGFVGFFGEGSRF